MLHFPRLLTARLQVQLRELTMREAVSLAATPLGKHEAATTAFLALVVDRADGLHATPGRWTVQERMLAVAHYLSTAGGEGANFGVGDGRFLDYLHPAADHPGDTADAGEACGDQWQIKQLTGDEALAMEALCTTRFDWMAAGMAAQMRAHDEAAPPDASDAPGEYADWLAARVRDVQDMAEGDFGDLFTAYAAGKRALFHLFELDFDAAGHIALARNHGGGDQSMAPARFPIGAAVGRFAQILGAGAD